MSVMSVTDARAKLKDVVNAVQSGEDVHLTQHGKVVAVVVHPHRAGARREVMQRAQELQDLLEAAREERRRGEPLRLGGGWPPGLSDQMISEMRAGRDRDVYEEMERGDR